MSINNKSTKDRLAKFFDKEGFYIILFLCVCIVAVTAVWVSRSGVRNEDSSNLGDVNDNQVTVDTPSKETTISTDEKVGLPATDDVIVSKAENKEADTVKKENTAPAVPAAKPANSANSIPAVKLDSPIKSKISEEGILRGHSTEDLVWFQYPNEWRVHLGLDLKALEGTEVLSAGGGKVVEVRNDNDGPGGLGWTVVVDHNNGYRSVYANLGETIDVEKDQVVEKGQKIGVIGNTSIFEKDKVNGDIVMSHLHFEVLKKGAKTYESVDPNKYLSMQN